jgi:putative nucleotidyltransferase with HDIG domain
LLRTKPLFAQVLLVLLLLGAAAASSTRFAWSQPDLLITLAVLAIGSHLLPMTARGVHISGSFMGLMLVMALCGPAPAVAIGVLAVLLDALRTRPPLWHLVSDGITYAVFPLLGGLFFDALRGVEADQHAPAFAITVALAFIALNLLNFVLTIEQLRLHRPQTPPLGEMLRLNVLPVLPWQLAAALVTAVVVYGTTQFGIAAVGLLVLVLFTFQLLLRAVLEAEHQRDQLASSFNELERMHEGLLVATLKTLSLRDRGTARHSAAVARYARAVAAAAGMDDGRQVLVHTAGLLHDIGKASFDDDLLTTAGRLTDAQRALIRRHPSEGARILRGVAGYAEVADIVEAHHERWDGGGYPHGLRREEIPELARIISVADAYDVMTARDSYRAAISHEQAVAELRRVAGTQLDPLIVDLFIATVEQGRVAFAHADDRDLELELRARAPSWPGQAAAARCANP